MGIRRVMTFIQSSSKNIFNLLNRHPAIFLTYCLAICWWGYLSLTSSHFIIFDSEDFMRIAQFFTHGGTVSDYFSTGPNREPLYPLFIALSLNLSSWCHVPFELMYNILSFGILFMIVLTIHRSCEMLKFCFPITWIIVTYTCFSPILINSTLAIYSELLAALFLLLTAVNFSLLITAAINKHPIKLHALYLSLSLLGLTLVKGIGEALSIFIFASLFFIIRRYHIRPAILIMALIIFYAPLTLFKATNYIYNKHFALTNRASDSLYGNITRRSKIPLTATNVLSQAATVPVSNDICGSLFTYDQCYQWSMSVGDDTAIHFRQKLAAQQLPDRQQQSLMRQETIHHYVNTLPSQLIYQLIESTKFFFTEMSQGAFVAYAAWIEKIHNHPLVINFFSFVVGGLLFLSFIINIIEACRRKDAAVLALLGVFVLVAFLFSFVHVLHRYTIPTLPLLILLGGNALNYMCRKSN